MKLVKVILSVDKDGKPNSSLKETVEPSKKITNREVIKLVNYPRASSLGFCNLAG
jgi:hypothetical protein